MLESPLTPFTLSVCSVNKSLKGQWASLACHETGSLVVQHAFENLEESAKDGIVDELLNQGAEVFGEVCTNQWGSYCIQHCWSPLPFFYDSVYLTHPSIGTRLHGTPRNGAPASSLGSSRVCYQ